MAISRKPKREVEEEPNFDAPLLAQKFDDVDGEDRQVEEDDRVALLEKQLQAMQDRLAERDNDLDYLRAPDGRSQVMDVAPIDVDPNTVQLPDPAIDPSGYANALDKRGEIRESNKRRREEWVSKQKTDFDDKVASLWDDFSDNYPDIAKNKKKVEFLANDLAEKAAKSGKDVQKYMFVTRKTFMRDLAKAYEEEFGEVEPTVEDDVDSERDTSRSNTRRRARSRDRDEADTGRSSGIFGSTAASGKRKKTEEDDDGSKSDLITDIHEMQRRTGFY